MNFLKISRPVGEGEVVAPCPEDGILSPRYWARLVTPEAYAQEGDRMGVAIGAARAGYVARFLAEPLPKPVGLWSLRDRKTQASVATAVIVFKPEIKKFGLEIQFVRGGDDIPTTMYRDLECLLEFCRRMDGFKRRWDRDTAQTARTL